VGDKILACSQNSISPASLHELFHLHKAVCLIVLYPVLDHIVVPGQEADGVDAKVINEEKIFVTARGSYILAAFLWLVCNREKYELIIIQVTKLQVMKPSSQV
jgi:hypothetical protein